MMDPLKNIVVIGDRVLIKPLEESNKTDSGLFLPPSVKERNAVHTGIVMRVGPGYPVPATQDPDAIFREDGGNQVNYVPLQVHEGDEALRATKRSTCIPTVLNWKSTVKNTSSSGRTQSCS